jgi:putative ATP-dependent endonuclease of the OLD family
MMFLAIEEPELYQHPRQARHFASVLRQIAQKPGASGVQIGYATHSPFFIEPRYFDQVRRVSRVAQSGMSAPNVQVDHATIERVCDRLREFFASAEVTVRSRWDQVCLQDLSEALFADVVVLVEGDDDKGILDGLAARDRTFESDGVVVACAQGKEGLYVPHAILTELGIPTIAVFDNDSGSPDRKRASGTDEIKAEKDAEQLDREHKRINRRLCRYFRQPQLDYPVGMFAQSFAAFDDRLEHQLALDWPEWETARDTLVASGRGTRTKNSASYRLAAEQSTTSPSGVLMEIVLNARALASGVRQMALAKASSDDDSRSEVMATTVG